jgi:branched-chain amino acid transport system ATP-binding protein
VLDVEQLVVRYGSAVALDGVDLHVQRDGRVAQVPEGRQMFAEMTVEDNLLLGAWRSKHRRDLSGILELLPDLARLRKQVAGTLSGGQQQMVAVGRALMADPDLLVIDELSLGLAPLVVADLASHLAALNAERGTTILLIEQEVTLAFSICPRAYVLEAGRIVAEGPSDELARSPVVLQAYLGGLSVPVEAEEVTR